MEQDIYLRSEKVNTILQQHPEMTLAEIKRIPEILNDPVLVLKSLGAGGQKTPAWFFSEPCGRRTGSRCWPFWTCALWKTVWPSTICRR